MNVAGLDYNVCADTLFGHAKGAFTGADVSRPGLVERASSRGDPFLDEIGDLSIPSQLSFSGCCKTVSTCRSDETNRNIRTPA